MSIVGPIKGDQGVAGLCLSFHPGNLIDSLLPLPSLEPWRKSGLVIGPGLLSLIIYNIYSGGATCKVRHPLTGGFTQ